MGIRRVLLAIAFAAAASPALGQLTTEQDHREALAHYRTGQELMSSERFEQAAEAFQRAIDKDRLLTLAHYGLGQANMELKRFASAIKAFKDCRHAYLTIYGLRERDRFGVERQRDEEIRELKDTIRRLMETGGGSFSNLKVAKLESRIQDLERQRTSNTAGFVSPPEVSLSLGSAFFRNGDLEDAEREWKAAISANPRLGEGHNNLAALYAMTGRKVEAEAAVKAAERAGYRVHPKLKEDIKRMSTTEVFSSAASAGNSVPAGNRQFRR